MFICFDTEDDSKELMESGKSGFLKTVTQIAAIAADGRKFYNKGNAKEFLKWLERQPEKFIYSLNIQYDLGNLFADDLSVLDQTLVGGRVIKAVWGKKVFVDVFNLWPMSVKMLGEAFDLLKIETGDMAQDKAYVFRDVEIIREAMLFTFRFCEQLGIGNVPATLGGMAVKVWKHLDGENTHDSIDLSREAYFGGRVELFKVFNDSDRVAYCDINSLYPFVMTQEFPGELSLVSEVPEMGIADVTVKVPKMEIPVLPYRRKDGRVFYPTGKFRGTFTAAELKAAVDRGAKVVQFHNGYGAEQAFNPYAYFVRKLYQDRLDSKSPAEKLFFKLLMNNLYGRLGTNGKIGRTVWFRNGTHVPSERVVISYQMPLSPETNWCHAAHVTSYGRLELLKYMERVGASNMIYCDTDSVIFDAPGGIPFETGKELGEMKIEQCCANCQKFFKTGKYPCCDNPAPVDFWAGCETYAPKMYRVGNSYKAKGVPKHLAKVFIETGRAEFDLPFKMREAIRFFDRDNSRKLSVWRKVTKEKRSTYDKKILKENRFYPCKVSQLV